MRISDELRPFLEGARFSNGLAVRFEFDEADCQLRSRIEWLEELCRNHQVIHLGCVDHDLAQAQRKRGRGKWLHARLHEAAARCLGVDIDVEGVSLLKQRFGYDDLLAANVLSDPCAPIFEQSWDDFLLGEVLEHTGDPVAFLSRLNERFGRQINRFIITVPNAFAAENFSAAKRGIEAINSDHRFWFTPYTLAKVCIDAGLNPERLILCRNGVVKRRTWFKNWKLSRQPLLRNNIIVLAAPG
ncbi:MAG: hypothetical protein GKR94_01200 [Gammaproteobacteria bacterium]|nr:hypothetical protein [Gammaproteobacteria bacterium]